jgi:glycine oxidase
MAVRVLVLGGGIAGCAAAMELAGRGAEVVLVDRDQPGTGATGASAGMLTPQYESGGPGPAFRFGLASKALWPAFAERLERLTDWAIGYRGDGMLVANRNSEEEEGARAALAWQGEAGLPGEILAPAEARRIHPGVDPEARSWSWLPAEAQVDTQRLAVALADAVRGVGGKVLAGRTAAAVAEEGGRATGAWLEDGTRLAADRVVLAAGAWSPLLGGLPRAIPVRPVRGQILRLLPDPPPPWPLVADHQGRYLVPRANGTLLVGATMEEVGYDDGVTEVGRALLSEAAMALLPGLERARIVERWAGLRPLTPDALPLLGPDPALEGLLYATGYGRNGILFAPLTARAVADLALQGHSDVEWEPFGVDRFPDARMSPTPHPRRTP